MRVTLAHMGRFADMMQPFLQDLGLDPVIAPHPSARTLERGAEVSPEFACMPLKLNVGTFMEAADMGADTVLMAGGLGPCRFGYYAELQREALRRAGYSMRMIVLEPPKGRFGELVATLRELLPGVTAARVLAAYSTAVARIDACDLVEAMGLTWFAHEARCGRSPARADMENRITEVAHARTRAAIGAAVRAAAAAFALPVDWPSDLGGPKRPLNVVVVGEIYSVIEPFVSMDLQLRLARRGVAVTQAVTLSDWVRQNLTLNPLRRRLYQRKVMSSARRYLGHWVGGEGLETVSTMAALGGRGAGADGIIHVMPFTCMPEIVAQSIAPRISADTGMPYMTLVFDEHASETGLETRLEAFVDMLSMRAASGEYEKPGSA